MQPNPAIIRANAAPIFPVPTIPTVFAEHVKADKTIQIEVAVTHPIVGAVDISIERQHERDGVLGDCVRRIGRDAEDSQAKFGRGGEIDVVIAGAPQGDKSSTASRQR